MTPVPYHGILVGKIAARLFRHRLTPELPSFLQFDKPSGQISQTKTNGDLPVTSPAKYAISVTNGVGTAPSPTASFTIEVAALT